jgi:hypothetical protein
VKISRERRACRVIGTVIATFVLMASFEIMSVGYGVLSGMPWLGTFQWSWLPQVYLGFAGWTLISWVKYSDCRVNGDLKAFGLILLGFFGPLTCYSLEGVLPEAVFAHRAAFMYLAIPAIVWKFPRYYSVPHGRSAPRYASSRA